MPPSQDKPLKPSSETLEQETHEAVAELKRPTLGLFLSGFMAGVGMGFSILLMGASLHHFRLGAGLEHFILANASTVGFILVILSHTDLFTEYTTIAILPVLAGKASLTSLMRLWGVVYGANLVGGVVIGALLVYLAPQLGTLERDAFGQLARKLTQHPALVLFISATLAGWLMGLLSWLITAGRETLSQVFFIWLITFIIGFTGLPHAITGAIEVFTATLTAAVLPAEAVVFLLWTTLGNALGGVLFAVIIRYSVMLSNKGRDVAKG